MTERAEEAKRGPIDGVSVRPLRQIADERGAVLHMMRADDPHFGAFGEIYFSLVYPGIIKAWHIHDRMTLNYACPVGAVKLALYDERAASPTHGNLMEIVTGERSYQLVTVPPGVWNGFKGVGTVPALVANCASIPHDPAEIHRVDPLENHIPYDWNRVHR
ncbi:MAG: dTDP-4-dehydrorhamnose 3,5-epimerase-like enzyme [Gemmatimonadetes bacterium]|nr:dTDP-4-dehydrorhamnose 3,5-epimerase-like enzyme [Gemmatimonadota bacterium]